MDKIYLSKVKLTLEDKDRLVRVDDQFIPRSWVGYLDNWTEEFFDMKIGNAIHTFSRNSAYFVPKKEETDASN